MNDRVKVERDGALAQVKLNRPDKRNGLDLPMFEQLSRTGREIAADKSVRAVILSGEGKGFSAGLDWMSFMALPDHGQGLLERPPDGLTNLAQEVAWVWQQAPMPVIAAVHGFALGGGLQIALGADLVYADESAQLSVMEGHYGLIPDMGITQTLLRRVSIDVAKELVFTARRFSAKEGAELGLVTRVVDDPRGAAKLTAVQIAKRNPYAVRAAKRLINEAWLMGPPQSFALETELQLPLLGSKNQLEAVQAVFQQRDPVFDDPE